MVIDLDYQEPSQYSAYAITHNNKIYWPSRSWIVWSDQADADEFYIGIENWLQFLYENPSAQWMPQRPLIGFDETQTRWKYWSVLSHRFNRGEFKVNFLEIE